MKTYSCYIVDDEPLAIKVIEQHLSKFDQFEVCGTSTDPVKAHAAIKSLQPDLVFLDIEMPDVNGLELLDLIHHQPEVIITTAYRDYAVEGFEHNVLDYLVKPIPFKRFLQAIDKFISRKQDENNSPTTPSYGYVFVKANRKTVKVNLDQILYVEGLKDYVRIFLEDQKILTKGSVGHFYKSLPKDRFCRVHKSFVVARGKITAYTTHDVEIGDIEIPIGRAYKASFLTWVEQ